MAAKVWRHFLCKSQRDVVIKYIMSKEEDHKTRSFQEKCIKILPDFAVK